MLILTREATTGPKSQIIIDKEIVVTVLEVRGGKVKLGIVADGKAIRRAEIQERDSRAA